MVNNTETSAKFKHLVPDDSNMQAFEYTFIDNRKVVLLDVFVPVKHINELKPGDRIISNVFKCSKTSYHIILTVERLDDYHVITKEKCHPAFDTCYKLLED